MFGYLTDNTVDIYYATLPEAFERMDKIPQWMSRLDIKVLQKCKSQNRRNELIYDRFILKNAIAYNIQSDPTQVILRKSRYGKLHLYKNNRNIQFSVAHSKNKLVCAFMKNCRLGVDIEYKKRNFLDVARCYFSVTEQEYLNQILEPEKNDAACMLWTRKEAYVKAKGKGILIPFDSFDVFTGSNAIYKTINIDKDFLLSIAVLNNGGDVNLRLMEVSLSDLNEKITNL